MNDFKAKLAAVLLRIVGPLYEWSVAENVEAERSRKKAAVIADGLRRLKEYRIRRRDGNLHSESYVSGGGRAPAETCNHLKGGYSSGPFKDYALSGHTFIDGHFEISCMRCPGKWKRGDADFEKMLRLLEHSTNRVSSSEVPIQSRYNKETNKWEHFDGATNKWI